MLDESQVARYLERLDFHARPARDLNTLRRLHLAHMLHVPFENLDIMCGIPVVIEREACYAKIVERRRGGFCYELNSLFASLLQALGFTVTLLAADVFDGQTYGEPFDHLLVAVELERQTWIADVGFGDSFRLPLSLNAPGPEQTGAVYDIVKQGEEYTLFRSKAGANRQPQYRFRRTPHELQDFAARCRYRQSSSQSHFTQKPICSIATPEGRISLSGKRRIVTTAYSRSEQSIADTAEYRAVLRRDFGITLGEDPISQLMEAGTAD